MKVSISIFASKAESEAYKAILGHIPFGWKLFANVPLAMVLKIEQDEISPREWDTYLKMSVDFILTDPNYRPVLAIEFDGLSEGFSSGERYVQKIKSKKDQFRALKMNFKLRVFAKCNFPLIVISFDELKSISREVGVYVINSIVGVYAAGLKIRSTIEAWDHEGRGESKGYKEILWDISRLETSCYFQADPTLRLLDKSWENFERIGAAWRMESLSKPEVMTAMKLKVPFKMLGCRFVAYGGDLERDVSTTVWVRNFAGSEMNWSLISFFIPKCGVNPLKVAENIAWYLGQKRAIEAAALWRRSKES